MKDIYITFSEALAALTPLQTKKFNTLRKTEYAGGNPTRCHRKHYGSGVIGQRIQGPCS